MSEPITVNTLLEAGVHFGHQTRRWNPKMKPYIFTSRGDIYILDLKQTLQSMDDAYTYVHDMAAKGGTMLFVGTKKQAQQAVQSAAERCGMPYVNTRWLGGMLTNLKTIRERVTRMEEIEAMIEDGRIDLLPKKEQQGLRKTLAKLQNNLNGVRDMRTAPNAIFIVDTIKEEIAVREARRVGATIIAMLDTNSDPDDAEIGIPANDDAIRSVDLMCNLMADAIVNGRGAEQQAADLAAEEAAPQAPVAEAAAAEEAPAEEAAAELAADEAAEAPAETPAE